MVLFIINTIQQSFFLVLYSYGLGGNNQKEDEKPISSSFCNYQVIRKKTQLVLYIFKGILINIVYLYFSPFIWGK